MSIDDQDERHRSLGHAEGAEPPDELQRAADALDQRSKEAQLRRPTNEELGLILAQALDQKRPGLMWVLLSRLPVKRDVEDAFQEVSLRAYVSLLNGKIEPTVERVIPVLYRIAINVSIDFLDEHTKRGVGKETHLEPDWQAPRSATQPPEAAHHVDAEMVFESYLAAARLGPKEERALRYKCKDALEPRDMAERYGGTANAWSVAVTSAVRKVRQIYEGMT